MNKRVKFDFEIDFTNGGGIQDRTSAWILTGMILTTSLADYIVKDMQLLMVGEVRILNKQITEEHKRHDQCN